MENSAYEISSFEKFQFGVTRAVITIIAIAAWLTIIAVVAFQLLRGIGASTQVSTAEINQSVPHPASVATAQQGTNTASVNYTVPSNLQDFFSGDNTAILDGWLEALDAGQKQDFFDNLSQIVLNTHQEASPEVVNAYKDIKLKKLAAAGFERYAQIAQIAASVGIIIAALFLVILTSLVLVLLRIERNTRRNKPT